MSAVEAEPSAPGDVGTVEPARGRVRRVVDVATQVLGMVAIVCIVAMLIATVADVSSRYVLGEAIHGVTELGEVAMVAIVFLGLGYAQSRGDHVAMTLVIRKVRPDIAAAINGMALLIVMVIVAWLLVATTERAIEAYAVAEYRFGMVQIPVWPARIAVAVGVAAYLIQVFFSVSDAIRDGRRARRGLVVADSGSI